MRGGVGTLASPVVEELLSPGIVRTAKEVRAYMSTKSEQSKTGTSRAYIKQADRRDIWHVVSPVLTLLVLLAVIGVAVMALVLLIRRLIDPASFLLQQQLFLLIMLTGLTAAIIAYTVTIARALKRIETWRRNGQTTKATAGLVVVIIIACVMVLPVILALFFH